MDTEHTPLPWYADYQIVRAQDTSVIALCKNTDEIGGREANAALIVHSVNLLPELVEALKMARPYVAALTPAMRPESFSTLATIDALLAKATS